MHEPEVADLTGTVSVSFSDGVGVLFSATKTRGGAFGPSSTENEALHASSGDVAFWGATNDWPQQVVAAIRKSDLLGPLIRKQIKRLMGAGVLYGTTEVNERGEEQRKVLQVLEIDQALRRTNVKVFLYEAWNDWLAQGNVFAELQTDFDGKVVGLYSQDATRCRLKRKDKMGRITQCYLSGKWSNGGAAQSEDTITLPALDPYYDPAGQIKKSKQGRFILPIRILVNDQDYYGEAPWHGLLHGPYLEYAEAILLSKLYLTKNLSLIRYQVEVGNEYWELAFPGFGKMKPEERKEKKDKVLKAFTTWVTGQEKAGRTMMTDMLIDEMPVPGKKEYRSLWKITPFKLELPEGAYIEDSAEIDAKIIRAFMDASLFGATPSKDRNSSGSGSDKRVAHTIELLDNQIDAEMILTPLDVMADVNGWHEKYGGGKLLKFWFKSLHTATADTSQGMVYEKDPNVPKPPKA